MKNGLLGPYTVQGILVHLRANHPPITEELGRAFIRAGMGALDGAGRDARLTTLGVSQAEAARLLGCSRWSIRRLVAVKKLTPRRLLGGLVRFDRAQVEALLTGEATS